MLKIKDLTHTFQCLNYRFDFSNNCNTRIRNLIYSYSYKPNGLTVKKKEILFFLSSWFSLYLVKLKPGR